MNSPNNKSGEIRNVGRKSERDFPLGWLIALSLVIALGAMGSYSLHQRISAHVFSGRSKLSELDRQAAPHRLRAEKAAREVVRGLTTHKELFHLGWLLMLDKLKDSQQTAQYLAEKLTPVSLHCRRIAEIYGVASNPEKQTQIAFPSTHIQRIEEEHLRASAYAVGGLSLEALFLNSTIRSLGRVSAALASRFAASWGAGAAAAVADGAFPFGDALGIVLAGGGTFWCLYDLWQGYRGLPLELTNSLHQGIGEFHEACRRSALP